MAEHTHEGWQEAAARLVEAFASTDPTPGGGAAAGTAAAIACALAQMAVGISLGSRKADEARKASLAEARTEFSGLGADFRRLTAEDAAAFERVMEAYRLPKDDPRRPGLLETALLEAARVPLETARRAAGALERALRLREKTIGTVASDMACAAHLLRAAGLCALENVEVNAGLLRDAAAAGALRERAGELRAALQEAG